MKQVLETAFTGGSAGTITINLEKDFDAEGNWTPVSPKNYSGVNNVVINGNGHVIKNLNNPLIIGSFAGTGTTISYANGDEVNTDDWRVGVVVGTANVGTVAMTNITESGNTLSQGTVTASEHSNLYGRTKDTGNVTLDGNKI